MPTLESGRGLLAVCPVCQHPWYKAGTQEYPRLTSEQLASLGATMHVDIHALHLLPRALCPICSAVYLGGMFSAGIYPQRVGYRFLWESASSPRRRLIVMICRREGRTLNALVPLSVEPLMESTRDLCSMLAWLETCAFPKNLWACPDEQCQHLAWRYPPGSTASGRVHQWRGYGWIAPCAPLGGEAVVSMAVAGDSAALVPLTSQLLSWSILARIMRTVL